MTTETSTPPISLGKFDFKRKEELFEKDISKNQIVHDSFKEGRKPVTVKFDAYLASDQIVVTEYGLSLPVTLAEEEDLERLHAYGEFLPSYLESQGAKDWDLTDFITDDEKIFLKLKFDKNKRPSFKSNITISQKKPQDAPVYNDQKVQVTAAVKFYFNFEENKAGASLKVINLKFELDEEEPPVPTKKAKRQKVAEPDEE